LLMFFLTIFLL